MRTIDKIFDAKFKAFGVTVTIFDLLYIMVISLMGIALRLYLYDIESGDYVTFFSEWIRECREAGGFPYLGIDPAVSEASTCNYSCMSQYFIVLMYYLGGIIDDIYLFKTFSVIFDFVCAITIMRIAYIATGGNLQKAFMAYSAVVFLPTVVLNSAAWAQTDSIYSAFVLLALLQVMKGNDARAFLYMAISYSFKQQAIFFAPFIIFMWLKNKIRIRYVLIIPIVHVASMIPAAIAGRKWSSLLDIYGSQATLYKRLSMNYPSIYTIISSDLSLEVREQLIPAGIATTVMILGMMAYYLYCRKFEITFKYMITLVIFSIELCCFCLPVMHERYGYVPEVLAVVYGLQGYKKLPICVMLQVISMITYSRYLFGSTVSSLWPISMAMLAVILVLGYDLYQQMQKSGQLS